MIRCLMAWVFLTLTVLACCNHVKAPNEYTFNPPQPGVAGQIVPVYIDKNFSWEHKGDIHFAFDEWNKALNGYEQFSIVEDSFDLDLEVLERIYRTEVGLLILQRSSKEGFVRSTPRLERALAWVNQPPEGEAHVINVLSDRIGARNIQMVLMHEIGHVLGLPDIPIYQTLMFPEYTGGSSCIDRITMQELSTFRPRFDWHHTNWCERPQ